jgi:aminoglycoside phosphotransferase (APT) family kinase protein
VTHGDFCAENLVFDTEGRLRVVDNESLGVGILALDLARVWARWPMAEAAWHEFLTAYRDGGGLPTQEADLRPWKLRTLVRSAWYRLCYGLSGTERALAELENLLNEG